MLLYGEFWGMLWETLTCSVQAPFGVTRRLCDSKTLHLLQIADEIYQTSPEFPSPNFLTVLHKAPFGTVEILKIEIVTFFFSLALTWDPRR